MTDVRMDLLEPSPTRTLCPYKGEAQYWNIRTRWHAHLDVTVDGVPQHRPMTPFSMST